MSSFSPKNIILGTARPRLIEDAPQGLSTPGWYGWTLWLAMLSMLAAAAAAIAPVAIDDSPAWITIALGLAPIAIIILPAVILRRQLAGLKARWFLLILVIFALAVRFASCPPIMLPVSECGPLLTSESLAANPDASLAARWLQWPWTLTHSELASWLAITAYSLITVVCVWAIGGTMLGRWTGRAGALLAAASPLAAAAACVDLTGEVPAVTVVLLALVVYVRMLDRGRQLWAAIIVGLLLAAAEVIWPGLYLLAIPLVVHLLVGWPDRAKAVLGGSLLLAAMLGVLITIFVLYPKVPVLTADHRDVWPVVPAGSAALADEQNKPDDSFNCLDVDEVRNRAIDHLGVVTHRRLDFGRSHSRPLWFMTWGDAGHLTQRLVVSNIAAMVLAAGLALLAFRGTLSGERNWLILPALMLSLAMLSLAWRMGAVPHLLLAHLLPILAALLFAPRMSAKRRGSAA